MCKFTQGDLSDSLKKVSVMDERTNAENPAEVGERHSTGSLVKARPNHRNIRREGRSGQVMMEQLGLPFVTAEKSKPKCDEARRAKQIVKSR